MPQMTTQCPRAVTLDFICQALDNAERDYVDDVCHSQRVLLVPHASATSYIDLTAGILRVRSAWRGIVPSADKPSLFPYISRHNRETVGPKATVYDYGDYLRVSAQTCLQIRSGMGSQQLEAYLLLSLIMVERFTSSLEKELDWATPASQDSFHQDILTTQHIAQINSGLCQQEATQPVGIDFVNTACHRLNLHIQRNGSVLRLADTPKLMGLNRETVLHLFGEDTWLSVSSLVRLPHEVSAEKLFLAANDSNICNALGEINVLGMRQFPYLRVDYSIPTGEGLSENQLDTQILVGVGVSTDLLTRLANRHPDMFTSH